MFDSEKYMEELIAALKQAFGSRLAYVGLQGSYLRNEATEESDIDPMVVIDGLSAEDLKTYRSLIERMVNAMNVCGTGTAVRKHATVLRRDFLTVWQNTQMNFPAGTANFIWKCTAAH